jgi:ABC-2 type transport system ATP-binding protein
VIEVENLTRRYGDFTAVDSVSFDIKRGQIVGLLGHNGAGKTTTLKMLTGYLEPTDGKIKIDGCDMPIAAHKIQKKLGYLSENSPLYPEMSVCEYLEFVANLREIKKSQQTIAINSAIEATGLGPKALATISTLSKGYKQRLGVAQAIIHSPEILVLDEPTSGLDPSQIIIMRQLIKKLSKTSTVLLSTHIMQEVEAICDRVIIIFNGKIAVDSSLDKLRENNQLYLSVDCSHNEVRNLLSSINGISDIEQTNKEQYYTNYTISFADVDINEITPNIAQKICSNGWKMYKLSSEKRTLETVFREVNQNLTGGGSHV